jgi:hypothetical protein
MTQQKPTVKIRCTPCWTISEFHIDRVPSDVVCPVCGTLLKLQVAYVPARPEPVRDRRKLVPAA